MVTFNKEKGCSGASKPEHCLISITPVNRLKSVIANRCCQNGNDMGSLYRTYTYAHTQQSSKSYVHKIIIQINKFSYITTVYI